MSENIHIVAGLGNPGPRYETTRHNAGFMLLDELHRRMNADRWKQWESAGEYARAEHKGRELFLVRPLTYMNDSGRMVNSFARFRKIGPAEVLVCFDDMALNAGQIRIRKSGSAGGQKGMADIIRLAGTEAIPRLRMGIGPKPDFIDAKDFVLSAFRQEEKEIFRSGVSKAADAVLLALDSGLETAMNCYNGNK